MAVLGKFLTRLVGPSAIISVLKQQDPKELAVDIARIVDRSLDAQFGHKKSETIQEVIIPFVSEFVRKFNSTLLEDKNDGVR